MAPPGPVGRGGLILPVPIKDLMDRGQEGCGADRAGGDRTLDAILSTLGSGQGVHLAAPLLHDGYGKQYILYA